MMDLTERLTRYLLKVECIRCGDDVYPHEDDARAEVEALIKYSGVIDVESLRAEMSRLCAYCCHVLDKDD